MTRSLVQLRSRKDIDFSQAKLLKSEILCYGVKCDESTFEKFRAQNPFFSRASGLGMGGYLTLPNGQFVNSNVYYGSRSDSPFEICTISNECRLFRRGLDLGLIQIAAGQDWYFDKTDSGIEMGKIAIAHGKNSLTVPVYADCQLFRSKLECRFCAIGRNVPDLDNLKIKRPKDAAQTVQRALASNPNFELELQGGTTLTEGSGFEIYLGVAEEIRRNSNIPISIEAAPPLNKRYLFEAVQIGVSGLLMNLDLFSEQARCEFMPGKAARFSIELYLNSLELAVSLLGAGNVGSCLIFGLEDPKFTLEGAKTLISLGVTPSIIPYRKVDGINAPSQIVDPKEYSDLVEQVAFLIKSVGLSTETPGCIGCGGCSIEGDFCK